MMLNRLTYLLVTIVASSGLLWPATIYAATYGDNIYGDCTYSQGCPANPVIQPIDSNPPTDGSAPPSQDRQDTPPAVKRSPQSAGNTNIGSANPRKLTNPSFGGAAYQKIGELVQKIPEPIAQSFPYILLLLLFLLAIRLLIQSRQEFKRVGVIARTIKDEKRLSLEKENFIMLSSHYLRTPISVVRGNIELMQSLKQISNELGATLTAAGNLLLEQISTLLDKEQSDQLAIIQPGSRSFSLRQTLNAYTLVPIISILVLMVITHLLFVDFRVTEPKLIDFLVQLVLAILIVQLLFSKFRQRHINKANRLDQEKILAEQRALDSARSEFILTAANDLDQRVQGLKQGLAPVIDKPEAAKVKGALEQLSAMVAKFRLVAVLQGQEIKTTKSVFMLRQLIEDVLKPYDHTAQARSIKFTSYTPDDQIVQQRPLVSIILQTLIDNALKFSPDNSTIDVTATTHGDKAVFSVSDQGQGIAKEKQDLLFKPFSRTESAETFNTEGLGFSLYLDKVIAHYLDGEIEVKSKQGQGTTVSVTLPSVI